MSTIRQSMFNKGIIVKNPSGLNPRDMETLEKWKKKEVDCPYCLYRSTLDQFAVLVAGSKRYPNKLSESSAHCPACHENMRIKTLIKITDMSVEDFSWWFWSNIFLYRMMERVDADNFFARVKLWPVEARNKFWEVYHLFKQSDDKSRTYEDYLNYLAYKEKFIEEVRKDAKQETS